MINKEIERKFLVNENEIPFDLKNMSYQDIVQGYVTSNENDLVFRLRNVLYRNKNGEPIGEDWWYTIKSLGTKIRDEYEIRLLREQFSVIWKLYDKLSLHKLRYDPPCIGVKKMDLDCFKNDLKGLWVVEIEFYSVEECDNYVPLKWFGKEVTEDVRYSNLQLVLNGIPKD